MTNNRAVVVAFVLGAIISAFVAGSFLPLGHAQDRGSKCRCLHRSSRSHT